MNKDEFLKRMEQVLSPLPLHERIEILGDYVEHFRAGEEQGKTEEEIAQSLGSPEELGYAFLEERGLDTSHIKLVKEENAQESPATEKEGKEDNTQVPLVPPAVPPSGAAYPPPAYPAPSGFPVSSPPPAYQPVQPVYVQAPPHTPAPYHAGDTGLATVLVVLFNVLIAVPVIIAVCSIVITLPVLVLAFFVAAIAMFITAIPLMVQPMAGAAMICLAIAFLALSVLLLVATILIIRGIVKLLVMYFRFCGRICREGRWPTGKEVR